MEILKQNPKTLVEIHNVLIQIKAAIITEQNASPLYNRLTGAIRKRFGVIVNVKTTSKKTYISPDYLFDFSKVLSINLFKLAKGNKRDSGTAKKVMRDQKKYGGKVSYSKAMITGKTAAEYTLYLNKEDVSTLSQKEFLLSVLTSIGSAFHMTSSLIHVEDAKLVINKMVSDSYTLTKWRGDLSTLKALGVIKTVKDANALTKRMNAGKRGGVAKTLLKRIKVNIVQQTPKGDGFVAKFGGSTKMLGLEKRDSLLTVAMTLFGLWVLFTAVLLIVYGLVMLVIPGLALPGFILIFIGVLVARASVTLLLLIHSLSKRDKANKAQTKAASYARAMRTNNVFTRLFTNLRKRFSSEEYVVGSHKLHMTTAETLALEESYLIAHDEYILTLI